MGFNFAIVMIYLTIESGYRGPLQNFVNAYLMDILAPMGFYFMFCTENIKNLFLKSWQIKGIIIILATFFVETAQYYNYQLFGNTFDPLDYLMYVVGVSLAVLLDLKIFPSILPFWNWQENDDSC